MQRFVSTHDRCTLAKGRILYLDVCLWVVIVLKCVFAREHIIIFPFLVALNQNINWAPGDFLSTKRLMNRTALAVHTTNETTVNLNNLNEHLLLDTSSSKGSKIIYKCMHFKTRCCLVMKESNGNKEWKIHIFIKTRGHQWQAGGVS